MPSESAGAPTPRQGHGHILRRGLVACQGKSGCRTVAGFTLVEMLAVIVIIAVLASSLAYAVTKARSLARQADCKSNMRQLGAAILIYRSDHGGSNPAWLSCLYPDYVDDLHLFVCRSDPNHGTGRTRAADLTPTDSLAQQFPETVDNNSNPGRTSLGTPWPNGCSVTANCAVAACSYFYEFSAAYCDPNWRPKPKPAWFEFKENELVHGNTTTDDQTSYSSSRLPMIRCYHHAKEGSIRGYANLTQKQRGAPGITSEKITINVAYAGNVYVGPLWWEGALKPGEQ